MPDEFFTVAEIAEMPKVNPQTVRNWIDRGALSSVRVGARRVRVRRSPLDAFLAARETGSQADDDSWKAIRSALAALGAAVDLEDGAALEKAISELTEAAREVS